MIVARKGIGSKIAHTLRWVVFIVAGVLLNLPIIMTLMTSFKTMADINTSPPPLIFSPTLDNYREVLAGGNTDLPSYILNSIVIAGGGALLAIALTFPAAYAIVRHEVGKSWLLPLITNLRAVPLIIFAIPIYLMFQLAGLLDTRTGMILIECVINIPVALVLFVGFIQDIPEEMDGGSKNERRIAPLCQGPSGRSITVIERRRQPPLGRIRSARGRVERMGYGGRVARRDGRRALRRILPTIVGNGRRHHARIRVDPDFAPPMDWLRLHMATRIKIGA